MFDIFQVWHFPRRVAWLALDRTTGPEPSQRRGGGTQTFDATIGLSSKQLLLWLHHVNSSMSYATVGIFCRIYTTFMATLIVPFSTSVVMCSCHQHCISCLPDLWLSECPHEYGPILTGTRCNVTVPVHLLMATSALVRSNTTLGSCCRSDKRRLLYLQQNHGDIGHHIHACQYCHSRHWQPRRSWRWRWRNGRPLRDHALPLLCCTPCSVPGGRGRTDHQFHHGAWLQTTSKVGIGAPPCHWQCSSWRTWHGIGCCR